MGVKTHNTVLEIMVKKVASNLQLYGSCEDVINATLNLFQVCLAGIIQQIVLCTSLYCWRLPYILVLYLSLVFFLFLSHLLLFLESIAAIGAVVSVSLTGDYDCALTVSIEVHF